MNYQPPHALLWKVLKANISVSQIVGYALAIIAGLTVVMLAVALYADGVRLTGRDGGEKLLPDDYKVLSKKRANTPLLFSGTTAGFTPAEIERLSAEPWVIRCAPFETSRFDSYVSVEFASGHFSTALFFEAVPDEFFDVLPDAWGFDSEHPEVPIILPADYLAMYNFGFAPARGLPRLSENMITKIPLKVYISGENGMTTIPGRIAGFSRRLNTIAVPIDFLRWANEKYGSDNAGQLANRLIAETIGGRDADAESYFRANGIEASGGSEGANRLTTLLRGFAGIVASVGVALCLLAFAIMTLSLRLLVQKNSGAIRDLRLLGIPSKTIAGRYRHLVVFSNIGALMVSCVIVAIAAGMWRSVMYSLSIPPAPLYPAIGMGIVVTLLLTIGCAYSLGRMVADRKSVSS